MSAFILSNEKGKFKNLNLNYSRPRVQGLATQIWVATHYLRTPALVYTL